MPMIAIVVGTAARSRDNATPDPTAQNAFPCRRASAVWVSPQQVDGQHIDARPVGPPPLETLGDVVLVAREAKRCRLGRGPRVMVVWSWRPVRAVGTQQVQAGPVVGSEAPLAAEVGRGVDVGLGRAGHLRLPRGHLRVVKACDPVEDADLAIAAASRAL